ncbi:pentatricopeptide repeat-containing protein At3g12770-like [Impatiens glandulifera]|uniref:pentatricopeptide repeat-containing protein At3g12770-like n=1 Tax=Impatiens glandulifera TaxID=253017 RepID=UPI001FB0AFB4|nr:pentatricopeptide repeat-containing protein At3g12770-like [Impatiens glandulifera]
MEKTKSFLSSSFGHEINRLFSTSSSALSMAKSSASYHQPQTKPYIHEPNFNLIRHFIDTLLKCNNLEQIRQVHAHITIYIPDNYTLPSVIRACRDDKHLIFGKLIHQITFKFGWQLNEFIVAALVDMYASCDLFHDARQLFDKMPKRDLTTWTVMVSAFAKSGNPSESLVLFDSMIDESFVLDKISMVTVVNACAKTGDMNKARLIHVYLLWRNFSIDVILGSTIIDMYAKCGNVDYARVIFDGMSRKNVTSLICLV